MLNLTIRFLLLYFFVVLSMKLMGKRQIGQMQMSEFVTAFFLSELATYTVTDPNVPVLYGLIPTLMLIALEVMISFFTLKSPLMKRIFDFSPTMMIREGKILQNEMVKNRITLDELFSQLRCAGYYDLNKVRFAILEPNGLLSVVPYAEAEAPTREDLGQSTLDAGYYVAVIDDGKINDKALHTIGRDRRWLSGVLSNNGIATESEVFLLAADFCGNTKLAIKQEREGSDE